MSKYLQAKSRLDTLSPVLKRTGFRRTAILVDEIHAIFCNGNATISPTHQMAREISIARQASDALGVCENEAGELRELVAGRTNKLETTGLRVVVDEDNNATVKKKEFNLAFWQTVASGIGLFIVGIEYWLDFFNQKTSGIILISSLMGLGIGVYTLAKVYDAEVPYRLEKFLKNVETIQNKVASALGEIVASFGEHDSVVAADIKTAGGVGREQAVIGQGTEAAGAKTTSS